MRQLHLAMTTLWAALLGLVLGAAAIAPALGQDAQTHKAAGLAAIQSREFPVAAKEFKAALATGEKDERVIGEINFFLGVSRQLEADALGTGNAPEAQKLRTEARDAFQKATFLRPDAAGGWNNLALVSARLGENDAAAKAFRAAIELDSREHVTYLLNYAEFLRSTEKYEDARRFYQQAADLDPASKRAREGLDGHYLKADRAALGPFILQLQGDGQVEWAQDLSLRALETSQPADRGLSLYWNIVARSLARQDYDPAEFVKGSVGQRLAKLQQSVQHKDQALELLALHTAEEFVPRKFVWWRSQVRTDGTGQTPPDGWPQEGFCELARSLGSWCERAGRRERAEQYYRLAYRLTDDYLDPVAIIKLADLWIKTDQLPKLDEFLKSDELIIFEGKGEAIRSGNYRRIYDMHRALANVYIYLNRWQSNSRFHNAEFQIQAALDCANRFNNQSQAEKRPQRLGDWRLAEKLASHYDREDPRRAFAFRVKQTEKFRSDQMGFEATSLYRPIAGKRPPQGLDDQDVIRGYQTLEREYEKGQQQFAIPETPDPREGLYKPTRVPRGDGQIVIRGGTEVPAGEIDRISRAIGEALDRTTPSPKSPPASRGKPNRVSLLPPDMASDVESIKFDGQEGQVEVKIAGKPVRVPFSIENPKGDAKPPPFRMVKP